MAAKLNFSISAWAGRAQRRIVTDLEPEALGSFPSVDEAVFIAYLDSNDAEAKSVFEAVASSYSQEFTFGIYDTGRHGDMEGIAESAVKCFRFLDRDEKILRGPFDRTSLETFVKEASVREPLWTSKLAKLTLCSVPSLGNFCLTIIKASVMQVMSPKMATLWLQT